jgi:hypothetical protein
MKSIWTILILVLCGNVFAQETSDNLLLSYPFDGDVNDYSGNEYNATSFGTTFATDRFGNENSCVYFDGVDDYINFPNLDVLKPPLPVSFSFWIKYMGSSYQSQVVFNTSEEENHSTSVVFNATGDNHYAINCSDGQYFYGESSRRSFVSNTSIMTETWHQIVIVVNSETDMQIYVDCNKSEGVYSGSGGPLQYSLQPGCLGRHDRNTDLPIDYFNGYIDDFKYWGKALSQEDIGNMCTDLYVAAPTIVKNTFEVYPNPANDRIFIKLNGISANTVSIYNTLGEKCYSGPFDSGISTANLSAGMYIVKLESENGNLPVRKIIIQ